MNTLTATNPLGAPSRDLPPPSQALPMVARALLARLRHLRHGSISLYLPDGTSITEGDGRGPHAALHLRNFQPIVAALRSGDIGFAESYIAGDWTTPNLAVLLGLALGNRAVLDDVIHGSWFGRLVHRLRHRLHRNTRANSRRNIQAHYDLGNDFYRLWLDPSMNYSSALFGDRMDQDLCSAQDAKVRRALQCCDLQPGDRLLEIGCGWGALAQMAVREFGARVTGVTLSYEQLAWARRRLADAGERAELRLQDYRDIDDGPYDAVCSIEMLEAVGREYWPRYFSRLAALLRPGGKACIQSIVIRDELFGRYVRSTDFIQQYIFPGGCLPSPGEVRRAAQQAGLAVVEEFAFGRDYAETCRRWRAAFLAQRDALPALGFDERFVRTWEFYLAYCEAGFDAGDIDVVQYTLVRPGGQDTDRLPRQCGRPPAG